VLQCLPERDNGAVDHCRPPTSPPAIVTSSRVGAVQSRQRPPRTPKVVCADMRLTCGPNPAPPGDRRFGATSISGARDRRTGAAQALEAVLSVLDDLVRHQPQDRRGNRGEAAHGNARRLPALWRLSCQRAPRTLLAASGIAGSPSWFKAGSPARGPRRPDRRSHAASGRGGLG
jgi:hypothetical protein